ncbi:unnamed protein product [Chrysoparadoxa australica]
MADTFMKSLRGGGAPPRPGQSQPGLKKKKSVRWDDSDEASASSEPLAMTAGSRDGGVNSMSHLRVSRAPVGAGRPALGAAPSEPSTVHVGDKRSARSTGMAGGAMRIRTPCKTKRPRMDLSQHQAFDSSAPKQSATRLAGGASTSLRPSRQSLGPGGFAEARGRGSTHPSSRQSLGPRATLARTNSSSSANCGISSSARLFHKVPGTPMQLAEGTPARPLQRATSDLLSNGSCSWGERLLGDGGSKAGEGLGTGIRNRRGPSPSSPTGAVIRESSFVRGGQALREPESVSSSNSSFLNVSAVHPEAELCELALNSKHADARVDAAEAGHAQNSQEVDHTAHAEDESLQKTEVDAGEDFNLSKASECPQLPLGITSPLKDSGALKLRLQELQDKVATLKEEKVSLSMALAPLQGKLESREKEWKVEREELETKLRVSEGAAKGAKERSGELEKELQAVAEERSSLHNEVRRLKRTAEEKETKTSNDFWQRTVAATREMNRLDEELSGAKDAAEVFKKQHEQMSCEIGPLREEVCSLKARLVESERMASRALTAEAAARDKSMETEVLQQEFGATSAALIAAQTELAEKKEELSQVREAEALKWHGKIQSLEEDRIRLQRALYSQGSASDAAEARPEGQEAALSSNESGTDAGRDESVHAAGEMRQQEIMGLIQALSESKQRVHTLEGKLSEAEKQRRAMHNKIQEMRGNVRVFVRTRPFLPNDNEQGTETVVHTSQETGTLAVQSHSFAFDHVFPPSTMQSDVFKEVGNFVQSALDGFKVCLFSYGQTGSGKTHTMQGSGQGVMRGIIPRAVEQILDQVSVLREANWDYSMEASFLELYNEQLRDLLLPANRGGGGQGIKGGWGATGSGEEIPKLSIKKTAGGTEVGGLTKMTIDTTDTQQGLLQLQELMAVAQRARSVARTNMNEQSSRSHSVFTLYLTGVNQGTGTQLQGVLHLVDLAGSERLSRSGAADDKKLLRETQAINKSLSCLADVFMALGSKNSHIPYRNSKLTFLLQDALGGDGKALMFVNLSPTQASVQETICSLRFASQVNQVELGQSKRQVCEREGPRCVPTSHPRMARTSCPPIPFMFYISYLLVCLC